MNMVKRAFSNPMPILPFHTHSISQLLRITRSMEGAMAYSTAPSAAVTEDEMCR